MCLGATPATPPDPQAETPKAAAPYPAGLSMPWRLIGIDAEVAAAARAALTATAKTLAASWLTTPQPFTAALQSAKPTINKPTINNRRITDQISAGQPQNSTGAPALTLEPSWCTLMNRHLFFVTVTDTQLNTVLGSAHVAIGRDDWKKLRGTAAQTAYLNSKIPALATQALTAAAGGSKPAPDAMHVAFALGKEVTRKNEGSSLCLNQLLEEKLGPRYTVARALGHDHLALVRDLLGQPPALRRPTRTLILNWDHASAAEFKPQVPVNFTLNASLAETVYGKHIPVDYKGDWTCQDSSNSGINCRGSGEAALTKLLDDESKTLLLSDWPQVARRDRAWVYLDRGRAWGLKMNDRMVAEIDGQQVKGHVVHFFGPEAKLKSPRGFAINEGAVLYIRLNQKLPTLGTTFRFDPRTFPTKYPP